jgi:hypothetical protein
MDLTSSASSLISAFRRLETDIDASGSSSRIPCALAGAYDINDEEDAVASRLEKPSIFPGYLQTVAHTSGDRMGVIASDVAVPIARIFR